MKGYVPTNFNPGSFKSPDKLYYILTLLYWGKVFNKIESQDSFIPLSAKILKYILWDYQTPLSYLISIGVIETNNRYIVGQTSKGYRLTLTYAGAGYKQTEIHSKRIIKKVTQFKNKQIKEMKAMQHIHIWNCLNQITMNSDGARNYIENANLEAEKYFSYLIAIEMIESRTFFQTVDNTAGRLHNNITNLSRQIRPFLRYGNENLIEIDIANSQPFLFNVLISEALKNPSFHSFFNFNHGNIILSYDSGLERYKELTSRGELYEYLMKEMGIKEDRETFKKRFFGKICYCKENPRYITRERKIFAKLFPAVSAIISYYKIEDYKQLAIKLQRAEADIMINTVAKKLAEQGIFLLTIHDSILTTKENVEIVKETILTEFKNKFNLIPTFKIKGA